MLKFTLALLICFLWSIACGAAEMTPAYAYERVRTVMSDNPQAARQRESALNYYLLALWKDTIPGPPETGSSVILAIADDPLNDADIRAKAVKALHWFHNDVVLQRVREYLQDTLLEVSAATVLVRWGYWDDGAPILLEHEEYWPLARYDYDRAEAALREAAENASPRGRISAAYELANQYGDRGELDRIARLLIDTYALNDQSHPDSDNVRKALNAAYSALLHENAKPEDMERYRVGVRNRHSIVRGVAFRGLSSLAQSGNPAATAEIMRLKDESPYQDIKNYAEIALRQMNLQR